MPWGAGVQAILACTVIAVSRQARAWACAGSSTRLFRDELAVVVEVGEGAADGHPRDLRRRHTAGDTVGMPPLQGANPQGRSLPRHSSSTFWGFVVSISGGLVYR